MRLLAAAALAFAGANAVADELGREVFTRIAEPPCAVCHTLEAAGTSGKLGPPLDQLKPDKERALKAIREGVGVMPPYEGKLTPEQIEAVAAYVAEAVR